MARFRSSEALSSPWSNRCQFPHCTHTHTHFSDLKGSPTRPRHPNKSSMWLPEARKTERQKRRQRRDAEGGEVIREDFPQEVPPGSGRCLLP